LLSDGQAKVLPTEVWRTEDGTKALVAGTTVLITRPFLPPANRPVFLSEIHLRCWADLALPAGADSSPNVGRNEPAGVRRTRNQGGHPARDDWVLFDQEVMRLFALDGGDLTRTELRKRMKNWAAQNMTNPPDDRTIERHLDRLVPDGILVG
jgi:hypothetical protein